jgi:TetR/AcrR family transcriptional repressor of nem operon
MRYAPDQKAETRRRLVREAAQRMRRDGPDGVGVADIMRGIGLTHGGFYAHFRSKADLVAQAVAQMFEDGAARYARWLDGAPAAARLGLFIDRYVSAAHRDQPARGCPLTCLAADMPRQGGAARAAFDAGVARIVGQLEAMLAATRPGLAPEARAALAASLLSEMAGAVALSRAVSDRTASDGLLAAARASLRARCGADLHPADLHPANAHQADSHRADSHQAHSHQAHSHQAHSHQERPTG